MTGYQETLTDPSYHRQVIVMTAPHVGNTGVNDDDPESRRIWVSGYVVRDPARVPSNWQSVRSLDDELRDQGVVGMKVGGTRTILIPSSLGYGASGSTGIPANAGLVFQVAVTALQ